MGHGADVVGRLRRHALEAALLVLADVTLVALGIVDGPWWVPTAWTLGGLGAIVVAFGLWPGAPGRAGLHARSAIQTAGLVAITYVTGWGATLVMTQLLAVADSVRHTGARAFRPVVGWAIVWTGLAQLATVVGITPTQVAPATGHVLAILGLVIVTVIGRRIERMTAAKEAVDAEAHAAETRHRTLLQASTDVILVIRDGVITAQVPEFSIFGYRTEDLIGRRYVDLLHPDDRDDVVVAVVEMLAEDGSTGLIEARLAHPDGHWVTAEFSCRNLHDDPTIRGFVVNARDVTERRLLQAQLEYRALHDVLTGMANRALLRDRLDRLLAADQRRPRPFAVLYLDIDEFKSINDSLGHEVGDRVLVEVADRIGDVLREGDTAARLGGDEFAILLVDTATAADAARVAGRALEILQAPLQVGGRPLRINASIGIVMHSDGTSAEELLRNADIAMYMAKRSGKGRFEVFRSAMHVAAVERLQLETDLAHALERDELVLHHQPIVSLADGRIVGVEALLRWEHPDRGLVAPADFVPLAEATGHIVPIGRWALHTACARVAEWQRAFPDIGPLGVAVNVSMVQLTTGDLGRDVRDALARAGLDAGRLTVELTESALAQHHDQVADVLDQLRADGVRIAIGGLGAEHSLLSRLQRFPVDVLKIDRAFVGGTIDGSQPPALVQAIVELGHRLQLQTVAGGLDGTAVAGDVMRPRAPHAGPA